MEMKSKLPDLSHSAAAPKETERPEKSKYETRILNDQYYIE